MVKPHRLPDFKKIYPEASEEVIAVLKRTERKMQYQEFDLKVEQIIIDQEKQTVMALVKMAGASGGFFHKNPIVRKEIDRAMEQQVGIINPRISFANYKR